MLYDSALSATHLAAFTDVWATPGFSCGFWGPHSGVKAAGLLLTEVHVLLKTHGQSCSTAGSLI